MKLLPAMLLAAAFLFTACEKEPIEKPLDKAIKLHISVTNVSSSTPLLISYGGDYGNYQTAYTPLDTLTIPFTPEPTASGSQRKDLIINSEFKLTYIFIKPLDDSKILWVRNSFNNHWDEYSSGYNSTISTNDSLFITITN